VRITVETDPHGRRALLGIWGDRLTARVVASDSHGARVAVVATEATLLGGDRVSIDLEVGPGAWLDLVEVTGTVAYDGRGRECCWSVSADVGPGGLLSWHGEPFVVSQGAGVRRQTRVRLAETALMCVRDSIVLGRHGEQPGQVTAETFVEYAGRPLFVETLELPVTVSGSSPDGVRAPQPGLLGPARVVDSVIVAGMRVDTPASPEVLQLAGPGTLFRSLDVSLHQSRLGRRWSEVASLLRAAW
jgi:urease accessory protein